MKSNRPEVCAMPGFDGWRVEMIRGDVVYIMSADDAESLGQALLAAAAEAKAKTAGELALPLAERVRLLLARLCYLPVRRIAKDLDASEANVQAALMALEAAGRVRSKAPDWPDLYEAVDRSGAWPEWP